MLRLWVPSTKPLSLSFKEVEEVEAEKRLGLVPCMLLRKASQFIDAGLKKLNSISGMEGLSMLVDKAETWAILSFFCGGNCRGSAGVWEISSICQGLTWLGFWETSDSSQLTYDIKMKSGKDEK